MTFHSNLIKHELVTESNPIVYHIKKIGAPLSHELAKLSVGKLLACRPFCFQSSDDVPPLSSSV